MPRQRQQSEDVLAAAVRQEAQALAGAVRAPADAHVVQVAQAQAEGKTSEDVIGQLLAAVSEPEPAKYEKRKKP